MSRFTRFLDIYIFRSTRETIRGSGWVLYIYIPFTDVVMCPLTAASVTYRDVAVRVTFEDVEVYTHWYQLKTYISVCMLIRGRRHLINIGYQFKTVIVSIASEVERPLSTTSGRRLCAVAETERRDWETSEQWRVILETEQSGWKSFGHVPCTMWNSLNKAIAAGKGITSIVDWGLFIQTFFHFLSMTRASACRHCSHCGKIGSKKQWRSGWQ